MTKTGHSSTGRTVVSRPAFAQSRFISALASILHNRNPDFSSSLNTSARNALMNREVCLFGTWFVTPLQEISLDRIRTKTLKHNIGNHLFAVPISIKVGRMQVEHLPEGERRDQQAAWREARRQNRAS